MWPRIQAEQRCISYVFRVTKSNKTIEANASTVSLRTLHERMGHMNTKTIKEMISKNIVKDIKFSNTEDFFSESCQFGKAHRLQFPKRSENHSRNLGEYIHSDIYSPFPKSIAESKYFVTFIDDVSDYRQVYFLKHKSDVVERFKEFDKLIANKFGHSIKILKVDNGREYCNDGIYSYLKSKGISMQNTAPYTPEQNGKIERKNRTIVEIARIIIYARNLSLKLWAEAVNTTVYILNRITSCKNMSITPYEMWTGCKPDLSHLKIFGLIAYAHIDKQFRKKLDNETKKTIFVGYQSNSKNYRLYPKTRKIMISRDFTFNEAAKEFDDLGEDDNNKACMQLLMEDQCLEDGSIQEYDFSHEEAEKDENEEAQEETKEKFQQPSTSKDQQSKHKSKSADESFIRQTEQRMFRNRYTLQCPSRYETNYVQYDSLVTFQKAITGSDSHK